MQRHCSRLPFGAGRRAGIAKATEQVEMALRAPG
jgi:hypothetical protein